MILMYHGIVDGFHPAERWCAGQALPLPCFEQQLNWLARHRRIVPLSDYLERMGRGRGALRNVVALTFDDGLASVFLHVYPLLRARAIPATLFLSTGHLQHGHLLWFSYLNALCYEGVYDEVAAVGVSFPLLSLGQRKRAGRSLLALARGSGDPRAFCKELEETYPLPSRVKADYEGMTSEQLAVFASCDFLEGGAHTVTHPYLHELPREEQAEEIFQGKHRLSELLGRPVRYFAYPNGDYNHDTLSLVKEAGFEAAFATCPRGLVADSAFEIGRVGVYSRSFLKFWLKANGVIGAARRVGLSVG